MNNPNTKRLATEADDDFDSSYERGITAIRDYQSVYPLAFKVTINIEEFLKNALLAFAKSTPANALHLIEIVETQAPEIDNGLVKAVIAAFPPGRAHMARKTRSKYITENFSFEQVYGEPSLVSRDDKEIITSYISTAYETGTVPPFIKDWCTVEQLARVIKGGKANG